MPGSKNALAAIGYQASQTIAAIGEFQSDEMPYNV